MMPEPRLISGGIHRDARGEVKYVNAFQMERVDRFYTVHPAVENQVRGWVGHQRDWKWFFVPHGAMDIVAVAPDDWASPSRNLPQLRFRLTEDVSQVLEMPPGFFVASIARQPGTVMLVFSSGVMADVKGDDFRLPPDYWAVSP